MQKTVKIKKGLDIPLKGSAEKDFRKREFSSYYALKPHDFNGMRPKVIAKEGTEVKAGSLVYYNKLNEDAKFLSPVSGKVTEIVRGEKRKILEIRIEADGKNQKEKFEIPDIAKAEQDDVKKVLIESGLWTSILQRPYGIVPNSDDVPDAVFMSLFKTAPLSPDMDFILKDKIEDLKKGMEVLHIISDKKIHVSLDAKKSNKELYKDLPHAEFHYFQGPHPAGNTGTQINKIRPINKGEKFWTIDPQDLAIIGRFFNTGEYNPERTIALAGSELGETFYTKSLPGESLKDLADKYKTNDNVRFISGDVLTGTKLTEDVYMSSGDVMLTVIPEGNYYEFFGWAAPGFNKFSTSGTYFSWLFPKKKYRIDTNYHGGERAYVMTGEYEKVCPIDIYPQLLIKACITDDIDKMEELGIYEVLEEDLALCEFVCTSKTPVQKILRKSLEMLREELS